MSDQVKIYVSKYALSTGIFEVMAKIEDGMATCRRDGRFIECFHGKSWHYTKEHAIAEAEEMRIRKLKSLEEQAKKISALKFEVTP